MKFYSKKIAFAKFHSNRLFVEILHKNDDITKCVSESTVCGDLSNLDQFRSMQKLYFSKSIICWNIIRTDGGWSKFHSKRWFVKIWSNLYTLSEFKSKSILKQNFSQNDDLSKIISKLIFFLKIQSTRWFVEKSIFRQNLTQNDALTKVHSKLWFIEIWLEPILCRRLTRTDPLSKFYSNRWFAKISYEPSICWRFF